MEKTVKKGRNSSIELLRIVCLVMIFWMHAADSGVANGIGAWIDIAVAVIVEDSGSGSEYAVPIAKKIFDAYYQ